MPRLDGTQRGPLGPSLLDRPQRASLAGSLLEPHSGGRSGGDAMRDADMFCAAGLWYGS